MIRFYSGPIMIALFCLCSCTSNVHLISPFPDERLSLPGGEAPLFKWEIPDYEDEASYHLEVSTQSSLANPVISAEGLKTCSLQPEKEEFFLPGDTHYYWRVTGYHLDKYGQVEETFLCVMNRSFFIEKRPTVRILFKIPPSSREGTITVRIKDEEFDKDFTRDMEVGESLNLTAILTEGSAKKEIGGKLIVHRSNETTEFGNIIVDSLTREEMEDVLKGKVDQHTFSLAKEDIVTLRLGSRTEYQDVGVE